MFKRKMLSEQICVALFATLAVTVPIQVYAQEVSDEETKKDSLKENTSIEEDLEELDVITVIGIRSSLKESLSAKKNAQQIIDAISSEDIGKLPDTNVAEALSRVTGVQIDRNDAGDGAGFQVRGLSQNRVEVNGRSMVSNGDGTRTNSFNATSSALFKGIEVIKSPTADTVEGALGATIRLKTFKPLDFKKDYTYTGNFQHVRQDNDNEDEGMILTSLFASRWKVNDGDMGALLNVSYEDRDISTTRWTGEWNVPQGRPNTQCSSGSGDAAMGVFDPSRDDINSPHACYAIANGTIYGPDGTAASGVPYPIKDFDYGLNSGGGIPSNHPLLNYSVLHPNQLAWEYKPFNNKKVGVDFNFEWAPNSLFDTYVQATYQEFEQLRPQSKIIIPAGAGSANSRLQDNFIIQEFSRQPSGAEYIVTDQVTDMPFIEDGEIVGYFTPAEDSVRHGVLVAGNMTQDSVRFANNNKNNEEKQLILATGFNYSSDLWEISGEVSSSSSKTFSDSLNLNMTFASEVQSIWDFTDERFDLPSVGIIGPNTVYDKQNDTCYTNDVDPNNEAVTPVYLGSYTDPTCGTGILEWQNFSFGSFNGNYTWFETEENSAKVDFDYYIDKAMFTKLEFGFRLTQSEFSREQIQLRDVNRANANPEIKFNTDPVLGDSNRDGISGDGEGEYVPIEMLEPGFVVDGLAQTPTFMSNYNASAFFPRSWLTQVNNEQYDVWFNRLTGHAFWRNNTSQEYVLEEDSQAFYIKANFESEIFNMRYWGNVGARYINYDFVVDSHELAIDSDGNVLQGVETIKTLDGVAVDVELDQLSTINRERSISKVLPSGNLIVEIRDDMLLRFSAAKALAMPDPRDLVETAPIIASGASGIVSHNTGNFDINPYEANQYDISWEWYMSDTSAFSSALFRKDLKTFIIKDSNISVVSDELLLNVKTPVNTDGGTINGLELSYRSTFDFLPGAWSGFGVETNYTYTDSSQNSGVNELTGEAVPIENLSENSYNFILFYDMYNFQFRAAYNWRDTNFKGISNGESDRSGFMTPVLDSSDETGQRFYTSQPYSVALGQYEVTRGTLDLSISYQFNKHLTFTLQGTNITNEPLERYQGVEGLTSSFIDPGASYRAAVRVAFR